MQIGKLISKIVVPTLAKEGFNKTIPEVAARSKYYKSWEFAKPKDGYHHYILIDTDTVPFPSGLEYTIAISLSSTFPKGGYVTSIDWMFERLPQEYTNVSREYFSTEQQIEAYLTEAVKLIVESAIPLFVYFDRPNFRPSIELHEALSSDTRLRAEMFMKQYNLSWAVDVKSVNEMIIKTEDVIKSVQFEPLEEVSELLVNATAFIGELIREVHGGEWAWFDSRVYILQKIGGYKSCQSGALGITFKYWVRPEIFDCCIRIHYYQLLFRLGLNSLMG